MGGDGMGGLAMAILLAMIGLFAGGFLIFFLIGRRLARNSPRRGLIATLTGLAGLGLGYMAGPILLNDPWSRPPTVRLETPAGYTHPDVILLLDRNAANALAWRNSGWLFPALTTTLTAPPNGVVRLNDIGPLYGRADATVEWPDGATSMGGGGGPAPAGLNAESYILLSRDNGPEAPQLPYHDEAALADYIKLREAQK